MLKRIGFTVLSNFFGALAGLAVICVATATTQAETAGGTCDIDTVKKTCPNRNCTTGCGPYNMGCQC